ncbi:helix-turn-helix domain-containing protein [Yersinia ruckeri]|uniref:phage repressor protein CI n=1 Tax=Yersinia ruckeri TaxID=29486 RepID=UPI0020BD8AAB|nr:phage repressor protein CI [Yersinia ruckeri]MCK8564435.1 helix-turn-helix domain-containing protein [Yersinia ruckeri]UZY19464.1 helix-turn-helix domain-containing protein [Yersinia ruckeri]
MDLNKGGRGAIERMVEAYGFTTRQALCDQLNVSKSTLATRYMRDSFPSDWVIQCALETGASLRWLTTGEGVMFESAQQTDIVQIPRKKLLDGKLYDSNFYMFDKTLLPDNLDSPIAVTVDKKIYLADLKLDEISNGMWIFKIDNNTVIGNILRIPKNKVKILMGATDFECPIDELMYIGRVKIEILES